VDREGYLEGEEVVYCSLGEVEFKESWEGLKVWGSCGFYE